MLSGSFAIAAGGFMVYTGQQAEMKLGILKRVLSDDESILVEMFRKKDSNMDGMLERWEFDRLIASMYLELNEEELKAAFDAIDVNKDNKIAYNEFRVWVRDNITAGLALPSETFYSNGYEV
jgi:Ca2+-binding EF-hand superfamily protein